MGSYLNPGNFSFRGSLRSKIYVDKSKLIAKTNEVLCTEQKYICVSRPRRFGKSMAANMLAAYYDRSENTEDLFQNLAISREKSYEENLNQYDVIHLDIQWCMEPAGGPENVVSYITEKTILELRNYYPEILPDSISSLPEALSCINTATGQKFVVIIDEWDVLIRDASTDLVVQEEYINFLRGMFKGSEPTKYIQLAYLTGILPIKKIKTQSALNNFAEFTMTDARIFSRYIGFTEEEVRMLCEKYHRDFSKTKHWYDGYLLEQYQVYNPKAVVELMIWNKFQSYWSDTGTYEAIVPLINMDFDGLKTAIIEMLSGNSVEIDPTTFQNDMVNFTCRDDILTCLIHLGYLGYDQDTHSAFVPNEEIRQELAKAVKRKKWNEFLTFQQESSELLDATLDMDTDTVARSIEKIHNEYASAIQYNNENSLSSILSIGYLSTMRYYFKPIREFPAGRGFADFVYLPKPEYSRDYPALVVELKWNQNAQTAIRQIKNRQYPEAVANYTDNILLVGISYDKKQKTHNCVIEKYSEK